jgi:hypothetical protein
MGIYAFFYWMNVPVYEEVYWSPFLFHKERFKKTRRAMLQGYYDLVRCLDDLEETE